MEGTNRNNRYQIIAQGGMGTVSRAHDTALQRQVAVEVLKTHPAVQEMCLRHPHHAVLWKAWQEKFGN